MTLTELRAVIDGLAPAVCEYVEASCSALSEKLAVLEAREQPGPMGPAGDPGIAGKDGRDGFGFDDFAVVHDGERGFTFRFTKGEQVKDFPFTVPVDIYRGVYVEGRTYERGDGATWGGSEWHCNETTTSKPGDGSKSWTLKVKRGRDGKDAGK